MYYLFSKRAIFLAFLFSMVILTGKSLYAQSLLSSGASNSPFVQLDGASLNLKEYINTVAYDKTELLCYSVAYPLYIYQRSGRYSPPPILSSRHIFWRDAKYRQAMLEWIFLSTDAFQTAWRSRESQQTTLNLYAQYSRYLVESTEFEKAIKDCALRYNHNLNAQALEEYEKSLKNILKDMILFTNKYTAVVGSNLLIEVPISVFAAPFILRAIKLVVGKLGTTIRWILNRFAPTPSANPLGLGGQLTRNQISRLGLYKSNVDTLFTGFFQWSKGDIGLEVGTLLALNYFFYQMIDANQNINVENQFRQVLPDEMLYHLDTEGKTRMRRWWNQKMENYENTILKRGVSIQRLSKSQPGSITTANAIREYTAWIDFSLVDYWMVTDKIERLTSNGSRMRIAENTRAYRSLKATSKLFELRIKQLERQLNHFQNGQWINAGHQYEHLTAVFKILEISETMKHLPYGYCTSPDYSMVDLPPLCRFHQLFTYRRMGQINSQEEQELQQLLDNLPQILADAPSYYNQ